MSINSNIGLKRIIHTVSGFLDNNDALINWLIIQFIITITISNLKYIINQLINFIGSDDIVIKLPNVQF